MRARIRACRSPPQQLSRMKADTMTIQMDCSASASSSSPPTPTKPMMTVTNRLRLRPSTNQSRDCKIWPPSSG